ncbi:Very-long-chain [Schistosoma japonicum]|nr:Very-long-chain [Schistosoma japonicum]
MIEHYQQLAHCKTRCGKLIRLYGQKQRIMSSDIVLNFYESLLREDDLETLEEGSFVNDNIITFQLEYLRHTKLSHSSNILLIDPAASQLLKLVDMESVGMVLDPLECKSKDWVFIVINDSTSQNSSGGCHWSLLIYSPLLVCAYYLDSLGFSPNYSQAVLLCNKLSTYFGISSVNVNLPNVIKQSNGYDCGIFCMVFIEIICDMILENDFSWQVTLASDKVSHRVRCKRKSLIKCINGLRTSDAQVSVRVSNPQTYKMACLTKSIHPFVHWGQSEEYIDSIVINQEEFMFSAVGVGADGVKKYEFSFSYYLPIVPEGSRYVVTSLSVNVKLRKELKDSWPRLTFNNQRLPWVRPDFDRYQFNDSDLENNEEECLKVNVVHPSKDERDRHNAEQMKLIDEEEWESFLNSILEPFHALLGWIRSGNVLASFFQVFGRSLVLFFIVLPHPQFHSESTTYWLFFAWSLIEIVRYPYYILSLLSFQNALITYLRHTLWIVLYPIGFICEGKLIIRSLPLLIESRKFCLELPNPTNFSFDFPIFLQIYLLVMLFGLYYLMRHLYVKRRKIIGPRPIKGADQMGHFSFIPFLYSLVRGSNRKKICARNTTTEKKYVNHRDALKLS